MKRVFSFILAFVMLCSTFTGLQTISTATELPTSGICGNNVIYTFNANTGELVISGTGPMYDYDRIEIEGTISPFNSQTAIKSVNLLSGVTSIGSGAFNSCSNLTDITIADSVLTIGTGAFWNCSNLASIRLPKNLQQIDEWAFENCISLNEIVLPDSLKWIDSSAFKNCSALKTIFLPQSVDTLGVEVFSGCTALEKMEVSLKNPVFDSRENCNAIILSEDNRLMEGCKNTVIPNSVNFIYQYAFYACTMLTDITIPASVRKIERGAFEKCSGLKSITFSSSVTNIEKHAFSGCSSLSDIYYIGTQKQWDNMSIGIDNNELLGATIHFNIAPAHKHSYKAVVVAPKANAAGYTQYKCACGDFKKDAKGNTIKDKYTNPTGKVKDFKCKTRKTSEQTLTWTKISGAKGYQVEYSKDSKKWATATKGTTATTITVKKLSVATSYKFRIRFFVSTPEGNKYSSWTTITSPTAPKGTTLSKVTAEKKAFIAKWKKVSGVTAYELQYSTDKNFKKNNKTVTIKGPASVSKTVKNLKEGTTYYVRIRTLKTISGVKCYSAWSAAKNLKTPATKTTSRTVYITKTGKRYHYDSKCGNGTYIKSTLKEAQKRGLTPCQKCVHN